MPDQHYRPPRMIFPDPITRHTMALAMALEQTTKEELRESLQRIAGYSKDSSIGDCHRDTYRHTAKLLRRTLREYR